MGTGFTEIIRFFLMDMSTNFPLIYLKSLNQIFFMWSHLCKSCLPIFMQVPSLLSTLEFFMCWKTRNDTWSKIYGHTSLLCYELSKIRNFAFSNIVASMRQFYTYSIVYKSKSLLSHSSCLNIKRNIYLYILIMTVYIH